MLKETIVVEGKNDAAAVRRAVEADIIITSGFGLSRETLQRIRTAQQRNGVIVLTDPDFMGEKIRKIIADKVKGVKHAFVPLEDAQTENDIGIENAKPESIKRALSMAKFEQHKECAMFTNEDIVLMGLSGQPNSSHLRGKIGGILGIGYGNAKQFLQRLNKYGITREEFIKAYEEVCKNLQ